MNSIKLQQGKLIDATDKEYINTEIDEIQTKALSRDLKFNFSLDRREGSDLTQYNNQLMFQHVPFDFKYSSLSKTFLHEVEQISVPAHSPEIVYSGNWSNSFSDLTYDQYGMTYYVTALPASAIFSFSGTAVFVKMYVTTNTNNSIVTYELSDDGGSTWKCNKILNLYNSFAANPSITYSLYTGLTYGDYKVRLTFKVLDINTKALLGFSYITPMIKKSVSGNVYRNTTDDKTLDELPLGTIKAIISAAVPMTTNTTIWNSLFLQTSIVNDFFEFKFYGSKVWVCLQIFSTATGSVGMSIDGSSSTVLSTPYTYLSNNPSTYSNSVWIRVDNGNLTDGLHTVKITNLEASALVFMGYGYYTELEDSTLCRSLICGKESYAVGIYDLTFSPHSWTTQIDNSTSFLRQRKYSNNQVNSYFTIQTPNNTGLKAVYFITDKYYDGGANNRGKIHITLNSTKDRYLDLAGSSTFMDQYTMLLYDSKFDGDLSNQTLKIEIIEANKIFMVQGIIFEIGDPFENDYLWCMPKLDNKSQNNYHNPLSSNLYRVNLSGTTFDKRPGVESVFHSGWIYIPTAQSRFLRTPMLQKLSAGNSPVYNIYSGVYPSDSQVQESQWADTINDGHGHPNCSETSVVVNGTGSDNYKKVIAKLGQVL